MDLGVKDKHLLTYIVPDPSLRAAQTEWWLWLPRHWLHYLLWIISGSFWTIVTDYWKQGSHRRTEGEVWYRAFFSSSHANKIEIQLSLSRIHNAKAICCLWSFQMSLLLVGWMFNHTPENLSPWRLVRVPSY